MCSLFISLLRRPLYTQMMGESVRLLSFQQQLEKETDGSVAFFGRSIDETMRMCLTNGLSRRADQIKTDFKVSDKRCVPPPLAASHSPHPHARIFRIGSGT